jgi:DNA sulfur modification protein DndD
MRIENVKLQNYRQYRDLEFSFNKKYTNDLHFFIGKNGTGKTNLLNAITWCLYGEESHLSKNSELLPILNLNSLKEAKEDDKRDVNVQVTFNIGNNRKIVFIRKAEYRIYKNKKEPIRQSTDFEAIILDASKDPVTLNKDEAEARVERFVPSQIKDFFFFDGERLDNYFKAATAQNIRHAIFIISQIELLENRLEQRLENVLNELRRDAGKSNPQIEKLAALLEEKGLELTSVDNRIFECKNSILQAKGIIENCSEKLQKMPDVVKLEDERIGLKSSTKHKKEILEEKIKEKEDLLFEFGKAIMLWPAIEKSIGIIIDKRNKQEIPPPIETNILIEIIKNNHCKICDRDLDNASEEAVNKLINELKLTSEIAKQLNEMDNPLNRLKDRIKQFKDRMRIITHEVTNYEKELESIQKRIDNIDKELSGYNSEKIKNWVNQRTTFQKIHDDKIREQSLLTAKKENLEKELQDLRQSFDDELKKEKRSAQLKKHIKFCAKALDVVSKTKVLIMNETREKIESETKDIFFKLIWKKETFKDINITDDFDINLIHAMGFPCLGSISAAERELLALSFTLALHKISGFDSPILIDTPVSRVSDEHRENLGSVFSNISNHKQIILLFTPAEYSQDISKSLDQIASTKYRFHLTKDEKEVKLEEI